MTYNVFGGTLSLPQLSYNCAVQLPPPSIIKGCCYHGHDEPFKHCLYKGTIPYVVVIVVLTMYSLELHCREN